jgi:hypothetical protein
MPHGHSVASNVESAPDARRLQHCGLHVEHDHEGLRCDIAGDTIPPMRLVLDTNILVAAIRSPTGASFALIEALLQREATLLLSVALFIEYQAVLLATRTPTSVGSE